MNQELVWEGDTPYGHYQIWDTLYDGRAARVLYSGERQAAQSGTAKDGKPELLFDYNQRVFELLTSLQPKQILLIGGAVCTLPKALLDAMPDVRIDVVEPDAGLTRLAYDFFDLPVDERLRIFHADGRSFLQANSERYEVILIDAFVHTAIPRELRTVEAFWAIADHLQPDGLLAMNVISCYHGSGSQLLRQIYAAVSQPFASVDIFLASQGYSLWLPQNFVLVAQKVADRLIQPYMRYEAVQPPEAHPNEILHDVL
ncbi:MAG TPA: fused MFS/spermidine synthase [Candidatus Saccharimonadales bacterium]|nr:fused MFS/spermidine synthase [Candidatus Saccharimonadales bacterium]